MRQVQGLWEISLGSALCTERDSQSLFLSWIELLKGWESRVWGSKGKTRILIVITSHHSGRDFHTWDSCWISKVLFFLSFPPATGVSQWWDKVIGLVAPLWAHLWVCLFSCSQQRIYFSFVNIRMPFGFHLLATLCHFCSLHPGSLLAWMSLCSFQFKFCKELGYYSVVICLLCLCESPTTQ